MNLFFDYGSFNVRTLNPSKSLKNSKLLSLLKPFDSFVLGVRQSDIQGDETDPNSIFCIAAIVLLFCPIKPTDTQNTIQFSCIIFVFWSFE